MLRARGNLIPGDLEGWRGLDIESIQRDVAFVFSGWGSGTNDQTVDVTVSVDTTKAFVIPTAFESQGTGGCSGASPWWYGGSVWVQSATLLRGTMKGVGAWGGGTFHADLYTLASKPKSIQLVAGGSSPVTILAIDPNRAMVIPVFWNVPTDINRAAIGFNSPTQVTVPTAGHTENLRWLIIDP